MDPLTEVLSLLDMRSGRFARLEAEEPWAVGFSGDRHLKFGTVLHGSCRLEVAGAPGVISLTEGDCYLIGSGCEYTLRGGLEVPVLPSTMVFSDHVYGAPVRLGSAADAVVMGCGFDLDGANAAAILDLLPPVVHVEAGLREADRIAAALDLIRVETEEPAVGTPFVAERLAHVVLVHLLRAHAKQRGSEGMAWLRALADRHIGAALGLLHEMPSYPWTVTELAARSGMSRSHFAASFKQAVGMPPLEYLASWRIRSASRDLRSGNSTIAAIAKRWGYRSESSFSHAFKRAMGCAPGRYRDEKRHSDRTGDS